MHENAANVGVKLGLSQTIGAAIGALTAFVSLNMIKRILGGDYIIKSLQYSLTLAILPTAALVWVTSPTQVYILCGALMSLIVAGSAFSPSMFQAMAPVNLRARVIACASVIFVSMGALGPFVTGALSDYFGPGDRTLLNLIVGLGTPGLVTAALLYRVSRGPMRSLIASVAKE
jgi:hypothetical protein